MTNIGVSAKSAVLVGPLLAVITAISACAVPSVQAQPAEASRGTVTGYLELAGGPYPGRTWKVPGIVTAYRRGARVTVRAGRHGEFRLLLTPGRYHLTGHPHGDKSLTCIAQSTVRVRAGRTIKGIDVVCAVP